LLHVFCILFVPVGSRSDEEGEESSLVPFLKDACIGFGTASARNVDSDDVTKDPTNTKVLGVEGGTVLCHDHTLRT